MNNYEKKDLLFGIFLILFFSFLTSYIISTSLNVHFNTNLSLMDGILIYLTFIFIIFIRIIYDIWCEKQ